MLKTALKTGAVFALIVATSIRLAPATDASPATVATRDGCANYWMFNGIWRVRVTGVAPQMDSGVQNGWQVTEEWRNGTTQTLTPITDSFTTAQQLVLQSGKIISTADATWATLSQQQVDYHQFPPSAAFTQTQKFTVVPKVDPSDKPVAVIIAFDTAKLSQFPSKPRFSISPPNYRIKFECSAAEIAKATAAQGGSHEVAAHEGCLNQWMSNGLWRVRVTNLAPSVNSSNQTAGWQLTETWVNQTGRQIIPNSTSMLDQQLALKNGDTVSTGNATTTTLIYQKLGFHNFAPGETFTHTQPFWPSPTFDASNKPVKLLMMFDANAQAKFTGLPHFPSGPANIRVSLDCTK